MNPSLWLLDMKKPERHHWSWTEDIWNREKQRYKKRAGENHTTKTTVYTEEPPADDLRTVGDKETDEEEEIRIV